MSVPAPMNDAVPEETVRVARAAFPKGNIFMRMHDEFAQFLAVCSASTLAVELRVSSPFSSHSHENKGGSVRLTRIRICRLQLTSDSV